MRKWIDLFESRQDLIDIDIERGSSVEGYVTGDSSIIANWFMHRHDVYDEATIEMVQGYDRVAFLNNINVAEEARGQGYGNKLLREFEQQADQFGATAIVLFADVFESQASGFSLVQWYQNNGYEEVKPEEGSFYCPLMLKEI